jgi:hypothetical protein
MKKYFDTTIEVAVWYLLFLVGMALSFAFIESILFVKAFYWAYISATSTAY